MLAEASTKDISAAVEPKSFEESKQVAKQGVRLIFWGVSILSE